MKLTSPKIYKFHSNQSTLNNCQPRFTMVKKLKKNKNYSEFKT